MASYSPTLISSYVTRSRPKPSPLYDVFWQFACSRHQVYTRRLSGAPYPWTDDPIICRYKFTNVFRACDRVSQYLIRIVYSDPDASPSTLLLRTLLFKVFNRIETWEAVVRKMGLPTFPSFDYARCEHILDHLRSTGKTIYSAAYIMPSGGRATGPKHKMHLNLIRKMVDDNLANLLGDCKSLSQVYAYLHSYPTLGPFLAYQYAIDLNYSPLMNHSENDFVMPGPGALDGVSKCFETLGDYTPSDTIRWLTDVQEDEFCRLGLQFPGLWGRPLHLIDTQNIFCEIAKYSRISHPDIAGRSGRKRIKQKYRMFGPLPPPFFPPQWGIPEAALRDYDNNLSLSLSGPGFSQPLAGSSMLEDGRLTPDPSN